MAALPVSMAELHRERLERLAARGPTVAHEVARGVVVSVRHLPGAAIGSIVWPGARALAGFIGEHPDTVRGRRVLELGAGVGLTALAVLATDAPDAVDVMRLLRENTAAVPAIRVEALSWGAAGWERLDHAGPPFDVVLAADCVYEPASAALLAETLNFACARGGVCYMAYKERGAGGAFFSALTRAGLRCADARGGGNGSASGGEDHAIIRIAR